MKKILFFVCLLIAGFSFGQGSWTLSGAKNRWGNGLGFSSKSAAQLSQFMNASDSLLIEWDRADSVPSVRYSVTGPWRKLATHASSVSSGMLFGENGSIVGSYYKKLNDSTITFRDSLFLQNIQTSQIPDGVDYSTFLGYSAGARFSQGTQGYANTGIGFMALGNTKSNVASQASSNIAIGHKAGLGNITGTGNTIIGTSSFALATDLSGVVAVGWHSFRVATAGSNSVAIGTDALENNTGASEQVAIGYEALNANLAGTYNNAVGAQALRNNITGIRNIAFGSFAGLNSRGSYNTFLGHSTDNNGAGSVNVLIGAYAVPSTPGAESELNIGNVILGKGTSLDSAQNANSQVGIGVNRASGIVASAKLQLDATNKGFLQPRMTETERAAISSPATGLSVYVTGTNKPKYYNGTAWVSPVDSATAAGAFQPLENQRLSTTNNVTFGSLTISGIINAAGLTVSGGIVGTIQTAAQPNITSLGTLTGLSVSGNIHADGNLTVAKGLFSGNVGVNGANLSALNGLAMPNQNYLYWYRSGTSGSANVAIRGNVDNLEFSSEGGLALTLGAGQSALFAGGILMPISTVKTGTYTATTSDYTIMTDATSGAFEVRLPDASTNRGRIVNVVTTNVNGNIITVRSGFGQLINGGGTYTIGGSGSVATVQFQCDGSNWYTISKQ